MRYAKILAEVAAVALLGGVVAFAVWNPAPGVEERERYEAAEAQAERDEAENVRRRQQWFERQRSFGGGIPRRALARAAAQTQALRDGALLAQAATSLSWTELGPRAIESRASGTPATWSNYGGVGALTGRVTAIVPHPTNQNVAYIGTANGGVWKTTNAGTSWTPVTDGKIASLSIGAVALDPANPELVYAGTGEGNGGTYYGAGLYRSPNGGGTWEKLGGTRFDGCTFAGIGVKPGAAATILVAVQGNWGLKPGGASGWCDNRGVWRSTDGGTSWTRVLVGANGAAWDLHVAPNNPNVWFATIGWDGVYRSTSSGASGTWTKLAGGLPTTAGGRVELDVAATPGSTSQTLYAAFTNNSSVSVYSSTNGGTSWSALSAPRSPESGYGFCGWGQCNYDLVLEIDPRNTKRFFLGGVWLNRYDNGAATVVSYNRIHVDFHALAMDAWGRLWVGSDGGVYRSADGGATYANLSADLALTQFYPGISGSLGTRLVGGSQDNGSSWYSGTDSWTMVEVADGAYAAANRTTGLPAFVSRYNLLIFKINNAAGTPCTQLETSGIPEAGNSELTPFIAPLVMHPASSSILYAGSKTLYRSTTANLTACGATKWSSYATGFDAFISAIGPAPSDTGVVYVGLRNGRVYVRRGAAGWSGDTSGGMGDKRWITDFAVDPASSSTAYVARSGFGAAHVYKTTNAGASWQSVSGNLPDTPVNALALDARTNVLYAGTDVGVFWTEDGGTTWQNTDVGLPTVVVSDLLLDTTANRLVAATYGRGMWSAVPAGFGQPAPANDTFAGAAAIGALPFAQAGIDTAAATETGEPQPSAACATGIGKTVWFRFQPGVTQQVGVDTQGSGFDTVLVVHRGTTLGGLVEVACDDDGIGAGGESRTSFTAQAGQTYYVQAGGWKNATTPPASGSLTLNARAVAPPNDGFANATAIASLPFAVAGASTTSATTETGEPQPAAACASGVGKTLWYRYQPGSDQIVSLSTQGSTFDTVAVVYRGTTLGGLVQVACDDDGIGQGGASKASFTAQAGQTYYVQVGGWTDASHPPSSGSLSLSLAQSGLAGDSFAGAVAIGALPFTQSGIATAAATTEAGEPQPPAACSSGVGKTLWFRYQPGTTQSVGFDTQGSSFDTVVAVYRGTTLGGLVQVACDDDFFGPGKESKATFTAQTGQTYYIQVGGWTDASHPPASGSLSVRLAAA